MPVHDDDAFRGGRLAWQFRRWGGNGDDVRLVEDLSASMRARLIAAAVLEPPEVPVLGVWRSHDDWALVTSRRVVWAGAAGRRSVAWPDLAGVTIDRADVIAARSFKRVDALTLETTSGERLRLRLEAGPPTQG